MNMPTSYRGRLYAFTTALLLLVMIVFCSCCIEGTRETKYGHNNIFKRKSRKPIPMFQHTILKFGNVPGKMTKILYYWYYCSRIKLQSVLFLPVWQVKVYMLLHCYRCCAQRSCYLGSKEAADSRVYWSLACVGSRHVKYGLIMKTFAAVLLFWPLVASLM